MHDVCVKCMFGEYYSPGRTASHREQLLNTTSLLSCHMAACVAPQEPNTVKRQVEVVSYIPKYYSECCQDATTDFILTSGVPQKVDVVPLGSMFSLHRPKSVRIMCPWESSRMFSGFRSL